MMQEDLQNTCLKCGIDRPDFMPGGIDDRCPNCGYKEGCCGDTEGQNECSKRVF